MDDNYESSLDKIPFTKLKAAIESIERDYKKDFPDADINTLEVTFEYLTGSFYPNVLKNIQDSIKLAYTQGYKQALEEKI